MDSTPAFDAANVQPPASPQSDDVNRQLLFPRGCESFQLYDEQGRIWPPGFKSQLCDPKHPNTMVSFNAITSARAKEAREQAAREGRGWANGTIESLAKPDYKTTPVPVIGQKPFKFKPGSVAEKAYIVLRDQGAKNTTELRKALFLKDHELKPYLKPAIRAGVILARRVEANLSVFELGRVLEVA